MPFSLSIYRHRGICLLIGVYACIYIYIYISVCVNWKRFI